MDSINRQLVHQRLAYVYDTTAGAQMMPEGIKKYAKALRDSVGLKDPTAGDAEDFMRDFGRGL